MQTLLALKLLFAGNFNVNRKRVVFFSNNDLELNGSIDVWLGIETLKWKRRDRIRC